MMIKCALCKGEGTWPPLTGICPICKGRGKIDDSELTEEGCALCKGEGTWPPLTEICSRCGGTGRVRQSGNILLLAVAAGKPYTARKELGAILGNLAGDIKVADPYYGTGSIQSLALLTNANSVKLLTAQRGSNTPKTIEQDIRDFIKENPEYEVDKYLGRDLHDRYVLTKDELILVGAGLKDIGNKESYVVKLPRSLAEDIFDSTHKAFDQKWNNSNPI